MLRPYTAHEFHAVFHVGQIVRIRSREQSDNQHITEGKYMITAIVTWNSGETFIHLGNMSVSLNTLFEDFEVWSNYRYGRFAMREADDEQS